jgi:hypothetical protein
MLGRLVELSATGTGNAPGGSGRRRRHSPRAPRSMPSARWAARPQHVEGLVLGAGPARSLARQSAGFLWACRPAQRALNLFETPPSLRRRSRACRLPKPAHRCSPSGPMNRSRCARPSLTGVALLALADAIIVLVLSGAVAGLRGGGHAAARRPALLAGHRGRHGRAADANLRSPRPTAPKAIADQPADRRCQLHPACLCDHRGCADRPARPRGPVRPQPHPAQRTAFEPGEPMAVDPAEDELAFFPLIYWPMPEAPMAVSDRLSPASTPI